MQSVELSQVFGYLLVKHNPHEAPRGLLEIPLTSVWKPKGQSLGLQTDTFSMDIQTDPLIKAALLCIQVARWSTGVKFQANSVELQFQQSGFHSGFHFKSRHIRQWLHIQKLLLSLLLPLLAASKLLFAQTRHSI